MTTEEKALLIADNIRHNKYEKNSVYMYTTSDGFSISIRSDEIDVEIEVKTKKYLGFFLGEDRYIRTPKEIIIRAYSGSVDHYPHFERGKISKEGFENLLSLVTERRLTSIQNNKEAFENFIK